MSHGEVLRERRAVPKVSAIELYRCTDWDKMGMWDGEYGRKAEAEEEVR